MRDLTHYIALPWQKERSLSYTPGVWLQQANITYTAWFGQSAAHNTRLFLYIFLDVVKNDEENGQI